MAKQRIAVLGGGLGALSAAFYLTEQPGWQQKYDITIYQQGWRLGGKCASGHDLRPKYAYRIYEHGLHIFAGWYDQAFHLLRRAYDEIARPNDHPNFTLWEAFDPQDKITLMDLDAQGNPTKPWFIDFAANADVPGNTLDVPSLSVLIQNLIGLVTNQSSTVAGSPLESALVVITDIIRNGVQTVEIDVAFQNIIDQLETYALSLVDPTVDPADAFRLNRALMGVFLAQTIIRGVTEDDVFTNGYDSIDNYEWSEWLHKYAVEVAMLYPAWGDPQQRADDLVNWPPMSSLYDYAFAYKDCDPGQPSFGAGTALRAALLMISYKGHFFYTMRGSMGDVVIAPIYLALVKRGVNFRFFSRITSLNIDANDDVLSSIDYVEQVQLTAPAAGYQPLVDVPIPNWMKPLEGWPAEPLWDQLVNGAALQQAGRDFEADQFGKAGQDDVARQLKRGQDFDIAVLGISVGGLKQVCSSFPARLPASNWAAMFNDIALTPTCAMQIWTKQTLSNMGSQNSHRTLTGAEQPYSTWSDMSHLLEREGWTGPQPPQAILYFCGQLKIQQGLASPHKQAGNAAVGWLNSNAGLYWSNAQLGGSPYGLDPAVIFDPDPAAGGDVFDRQYVRANSNPSDLYVQSPPGSVTSRMDANQSGLGNVFLAGDWTRNGLNSGCAESAARSGYRCALAITGALPPLLM